MKNSMERLLTLINDDFELTVRRVARSVVTPLTAALRKATGLRLEKKFHAGGSPARQGAVQISIRPWSDKTIKVLGNDEPLMSQVLAGILRLRLHRAQTAMLSSQRPIDILNDLNASRDMSRELPESLKEGLWAVNRLLRDLRPFDPIAFMSEAVRGDFMGAYLQRHDPVPGPSLFALKPGRPFVSPELKHLFLPAPGPQPGIELYWGAIGLVSETTGLDVEPLTAVVLAHEMAHALCHLGLDESGKSWPDKAFWNSEDFVVEGLAEFFTREVVHGKDPELLPGMWRTLRKMEKSLPPQYRYLPDLCRSKALGKRLHEVFRACRTWPKATMDRFEKELKAC